MKSPHKKPGWIALALLPFAVVATILTYLQSDDDNPSPASPTDTNNRSIQPEAEARALKDSAASPVSADIAELMNDPRVRSYLQRERDKDVLDKYFNGHGTGRSDAEIWQLIEKLESEGRVMAYEGLALKMAWLERNSANKAEFDAAAQALVETYRRKAEHSAEEYDPYEDVPGFAEYKEAERRIVREVQQMETFPNGLSRQEYLRQQLQAAREDAYSSGGN